MAHKDSRICKNEETNEDSRITLRGNIKNKAVKFFEKKNGEACGVYL